MDTSHDGLHLCAVPSRIGGSICRFDKTTWDGETWQGEPKACRITWNPLGIPPVMLTAIRAAWARWAAVCAIEPVELIARGPSMIVYENEPIDGPGSTLAWAELPCGKDPVWPQYRRTRYDSAEAWWYDPAQPPQRGIDLGAVACHEAGHLLGLEHDVRPGSRSLLAPTYNAAIRTPQEWDIAQAVRRYGPPIAKPGTPTPTPTPGASQPIRVVIGGVTYEGRVSPVAGTLSA